MEKMAVGFFFFSPLLQFWESLDPSVQMAPFLLVGLGNAGKSFVGTRHNIGFEVLDLLAARLGVSFEPSPTKAVNALVAKSERENLVLLKPQTMMNLSGVAVQAYLARNQIPHDRVVIIADNMDLPLGSLRLTTRGGAGGQKGVEDVLRHLGKESPLVRMKVGIGRPRPGLEASTYVLGRYSAAEKPVAEKVRERATDCLQVLMKEGLDRAMNTYHKVLVEAPVTPIAAHPTPPPPASV